MLTETDTIDALDLKVIRAIELSPRAPFRLIGDVLGVSEQTVARRYRRLVRAGVLRVTALLRPGAVGQHNWMVRVQVRPSGAEALARALAQREDVNWVTLVSGGAEVICVLRARTSESRDDLLMQRLPRTAPVLGLSAMMVLHRFAGAGDVRPEWSPHADQLDADQEAAMLATVLVPPEKDVRFDLLPGDLDLIAALVEDGRAPTARLATLAGMSESRAARRLTTLITEGAAYFDVDVSNSALGLHAAATLWLTVTPGELDAAGRALAAARECPFVAAVTGPSNLVASVTCRDVDDLYRFVTDTVGAIPGLNGFEVAPVLRHVKQAGALTDGDRLATA